MLKEFKERHAEGGSHAGGNKSGSGSTVSTPRGKGGRASAATTPKTPGSGAGKGKTNGKKRAADEDDGDENADTSPERTNSTVDLIARNKAPRAAASAKKVKYEEEPDVDDEGESNDDFDVV